MKANPGGTEVALPGDAPAPQPTNPREMARNAAKKKANEMAAKKQQGRFNTQVGGVYENSTPIDAWTKLAHALFQSNEAIFYN